MKLKNEWIAPFIYNGPRSSHLFLPSKFYDYDAFYCNCAWRLSLHTKYKYKVNPNLYVLKSFNFRFEPYSKEGIKIRIPTPAAESEISLVLENYS